MWSLPDIHRLNEDAAKQAAKDAKKTPKQILRGQTCGHCEEKATVYYDVYDIFSDDPKDRIFLCYEHDGYYGSPDEGYFTCDDCGRVFFENYTWELYVHRTNEGETLCLNCHFDREIDREENWHKGVDEVSEDMLFSAKHLIPVEGTHWQKHLELVDSITVDSSNGGLVTGFSSSSSVEDSIFELKRIVKVLKGKKYMLILDGAYQFATRIGVYIKKKAEREAA